VTAATGLNGAASRDAREQAAATINSIETRRSTRCFSQEDCQVECATSVFIGHNAVGFASKRRTAPILRSPNILLGDRALAIDATAAA
jgi:hypothetical protein